VWEIYAYHNTEALSGIFNAIAAIMASNTYLSAIAAVAFCGFVAAMIAYMFQPEKLQGWKWLITVVLVYGVLFVPRVTVGIVDKTGGTPNRIIANVPFGMAALGGLTSTIGNTITELFETAFQVLPGPAALPAELAYQQNGLMFGSRLIQETRRTSIPDPAVRTDIVNFVSNCTAYDIADGTISPTAFSTAADLWTTMGATNPARFSIITTATGVNTNTCDAVYTSINGRLPAQITDLTTRLGQRLNPSLSSLAAQAAVVNQIPQAYIRGQIATAASTAADLIRQNAMINAINDAGEMGCQKINDPSCMMLATGRASAVASQNAAWINGAKIAEQALPVVRNVAEAMCYAVFPLIVLLLFLSTGRTTLLILTGYVAALISIQLWPPLFAILNYMASIYSQLDQAAAAEVGGGVKALALQSASPIYSNAVSSQAVVSYLIIGIPMLAYSLANRLANFGSAMVGGLQSLQSASISGSPSAAAALGNSNMGNVTMDQRVVSPSTSNPWVSRAQDLDGNWTTTTGNGAQAISFLRNEGATSRVVSSRVSQSNVTEASRAAEAARSDVVSAGTELSSALVDTMSRASSRFQSSNQSSGQAISSSEELGQSADRIRGIAEQVSKVTGLTTSQVADIAFRLSGGVGLPGISPLKADASGSAGKAYRSDLSNQEQKVAGQLTNDQLREFRSFASRTTHDQSFTRALVADSRDGQELASRLSTATSRAESAQSVYSERQAVAERLSTAYERGETLSIDLAQLPANSDFMQRYQRLASQYGSDSLALQAAMASELATRALPPTRDRTSASALPASFGDVKSSHQLDLEDLLFSRSRVTAADQANDRSASPRISTRSLQAPDVPEDLGGVRADVASRTTAAASAPSAAATFDERNEITHNPDGTVGTKRSQLLGNARQLRDDVSNMADNARDLISGAPDRAAITNEQARARNAQSQRARDIEATPDVPAMQPKDGRRKAK
jgi:conjugal transfer mating pair stabilization protein TraG